MDKRREKLAEDFGVSAERMFEVLMTLTAIRSWFGASTAIVEAREGSSWMTAWGEDESGLEFVTSFGILKFEPPARVLLGYGKLRNEDRWPIATNITTDLVVEPTSTGCTLRIIQELDPHDELLDEYFDACVTGWQNSFEGIRNYLHHNPT
ncbi:MAG TPA: SRPBCC domain-containing protein [Pyrinomonadaceae bacterium]|nr:SRPBCC domain-containing protein [Pyrinomonadaceae bacterium]